MNDAPLRRERSALTGFAINRLDRREDLRNKPDAVTALVNQQTQGRLFGIIGEPHVNVLALNIALDQLGK